MGEEVTLDGPRTFTIHAEGYTDLARVDIVRDGDVVHGADADPVAVPGLDRRSAAAGVGRRRPAPPDGTAPCGAPAARSCRRRTGARTSRGVTHEVRGATPPPASVSPTAPSAAASS